MPKRNGPLETQGRFALGAILALLTLVSAACAPAASGSASIGAVGSISVTPSLSFGGRDEELCLAATTSPPTANAEVVIVVEPSDGIVGEARVVGRTNDQGFIAISWPLTPGASGDWRVSVDVTTPDGQSGHGQASAGVSDAGNPTQVESPPCENTAS